MARAASQMREGSSSYCSRSFRRNDMYFNAKEDIVETIRVMSPPNFILSFETNSFFPKDLDLLRTPRIQAMSIPEV